MDSAQNSDLAPFFLRFEPKVKTFLRLITFIDGVKDSVQYFLKFQGADTTDPIEPPPTYELKKPSIHVENGFDIHQGDTVLLKCSLLVPKVKVKVHVFCQSKIR